MEIEHGMSSRNSEQTSALVSPLPWNRFSVFLATCWMYPAIPCVQGTSRKPSLLATCSLRSRLH